MPVVAIHRKSCVTQFKIQEYYSESLTVLENFLRYCIREKDSCAHQMTIEEGKDLLQL